MKWKLRIQDPSGETRLLSLRGSAILGRGETATIPLRDPTVPAEAATLWTPPQKAFAANEESPFWLRVAEGGEPLQLGDLFVREAQLPAGLPIRVGETRLTLERETDLGSQPNQPTHIRPWLTCTDEGTQTLWLTKKAAHTPLSIYLAGETGTGKEVLAHLIHAWSGRASGPFIPLHCGALSMSLVESELFGHVKGAFTGASHHRPGALIQAHGGTLFLDEVGDLPLDIQVKLLRFLEDGEIRPVGSDRISHSDVRLLCATHHPLLQLVEQGKFRRDLYYRLASITIQIPTLRTRPKDIALLARRFAKEFKRGISAQALLRLQAHAWPGNVRELRHGVERACGLASPNSAMLDEKAFEFLLTPEHIHARPELELGVPVVSLDEMQRIMLLRALKLTSGNRGRAAQALGIARSTLFEMLKRHQITGPRSEKYYQV